MVKKGCGIAVLVVLAVIVISVIVTASKGDAPTTSAPSAAGPSSSAPSGDAPIHYEVTGKGRAGNVTYSANGGGSISQANNVRLPWTKDVPVDASSSFGVFTLSAQNSGSGTIGCRISQGGKVIQENTSDGQYAVVTCSGSP